MILKYNKVLGVGPRASLKKMEAAITACCAVLQKARASSSKNLELEVRLQNVAEPFFNRVAAYMDSQAGSWVCTDDFFSDCGVRTSRHCTTGETKHIRKTRLMHQDLNAQGTGEVCSLRMSLASEEPVEEVPFAVTLMMVRRKLRRSLILKNWRVDITRVWSAPTLAEVQRKHVLEKPTSYEIEVESLDLAELLRTKTDAHIAHDALLKTVALFKTSTPLVLTPTL